jgi:predicted short-subunit dehydrogenase-like oxidoreductase (DUF2520 family)
MSERIAIIGPGRMGLALGTALAATGEVDELVFYGRGVEPPPHPLFERGPDLGGASYRIGMQPLPEGTTVLILAVPDDAIAEVSHGLAAAGPAPQACVALHLSGAASTDPMGPLHAAGFPIGSLHPLQAVADPWSAGERLFGSAFAVAGEPEAVAAGRRLVTALGGRVLIVPPVLRPIYHAAAVVASNYLIALAALATRLLEQAGVPAEDRLPALLPLLRGTLDNLEHLGVTSALTGPIARGDVDTVRLHLARLSGAERSLYCALGAEALRLARSAGLDDLRAAELQALLASG